MTILGILQIILGPASPPPPHPRGVLPEKFDWVCVAHRNPYPISDQNL